LALKHSDDRITLANVKLYPCIGTTPEERSKPQECEADLTIWASLEAAAASDSIDDAIDYCLVLDEVQRIAAAQEYVLVETLAYRIVRSVLQKFPVERANVKLRKRPAALRDRIDFIEIEVEEK
jgi:7,8-dihydroneopterin aldolase/epimerase/oxygenase